MAGEIKEIAHFDRLIHEPARLAIMAVLSACESADFAYLLNATGLNKGNLSAQLSKLKEGGYIAIVKDLKGNYPHTTCSLTQTGRQAFTAYRKQYLALAKQLDDPENTEKEQKNSPAPTHPCAGAICLNNAVFP